MQKLWTFLIFMLAMNLQSVYSMNPARIPLSPFLEMNPVVEAAKNDDLYVIAAHKSYYDYDDGSIEILRAALYYAVKNGNFETINRVLILFPDRMISDQRNLALSHAAKFGHEHTVKALVNRASARAYQSSALCYASKKGHLAIVTILIEAGADVRTQNYKPLRLAGEKNHVDVVKKLLTAGADIRVLDNIHSTEIDAIKSLIKQKSELDDQLKNPNEKPTDPQLPPKNNSSDPVINISINQTSPTFLQKHYKSLIWSTAAISIMSTIKLLYDSFSIQAVEDFIAQPDNWMYWKKELMTKELSAMPVEELKSELKKGILNHYNDFDYLNAPQLAYDSFLTDINKEISKTKWYLAKSKFRKRWGFGLLQIDDDFVSKAKDGLKRLTILKEAFLSSQIKIDLKTKRLF